MTNTHNMRKYITTEDAWGSCTAGREVWVEEGTEPMVCPYCDSAYCLVEKNNESENAKQNDNSIMTENDNDTDDPFAVPHRPERQRVRKTETMTIRTTTFRGVDYDPDDAEIVGAWIDEDGNIVARVQSDTPDK